MSPLKGRPAEPYLPLPNSKTVWKRRLTALPVPPVPLVPSVAEGSVAEGSEVEGSNVEGSKAEGSAAEGPYSYLVAQRFLSVLPGGGLA